MIFYHDYIGVESLVVSHPQKGFKWLFELWWKQISGPSMLPTFNHPRLSGDIVLTEGITAWLPDWIENLNCLPDTFKSRLLSLLPKFQKGIKQSFLLLELSIGDVVLAYSPIELNKRICKRLIAEEGEIIQVSMDGSILQGKIVLVSYFFQLLGIFSQVPDGHVWLEGDCPKVSRDCRDYGPIPKALLHGRPWFQVWPLERFGWIKNQRKLER